MPLVISSPPNISGSSATRPGRFPAIVLPKYPHLSREDSVLASRFWASQTLGIERVDYDVRLGQGLVAGASVPPYLSRDWTELTKFRVDAVGYGAGVVWIIEFKPRVNLSLVGQLVSYSEMYRTQFRPSAPLQLVAVVSGIVPDLDGVLSTHGILVVVV